MQHQRRIDIKKVASLAMKLVLLHSKKEKDAHVIHLVLQ